MGEDVWTIRRALEWTEGYLGRKGDENPRLSAQWLLRDATGLSRIQLYANFDRPLSVGERDVLRDIVRRRGAGEPLQYITGEVGFRHITVKVREGVLIPRPETEVLVSAALRMLPAAPRYSCALGAEAEGAEQDELPGAEQEAPALLAADLCTGSGCIACSLAHERADVRVYATDIAPAAVQLARENAAQLGLTERVEVLECDMGAGVSRELLGAFDLVVSNPPYVPSAVLAELPREVAEYEPALALDGGEDGLRLYRRLLEFAQCALKPGGALAVELHETCLDEACALAQAAGFVACEVTEDLAGRPRVLTAGKALA